MKKAIPIRISNQNWRRITTTRTNQNKWIHSTCSNTSTSHSTTRSTPPLDSLSTFTPPTLHSTPFLFTPSTHHLSNNHHHQHQHRRVSDHEYQLRLGRAVHLLRATIPDFPRLGLVDYSNSNPNLDSNSNSNSNSLDSMGFPGLALSSLLRRSSNGNGSNHPINSHSWNGVPINNHSSSSSEGEEVSIYHPNVKFSYRPDKQEDQEGTPNLSFSGRTIYLASSQVLRHALNIIFTDFNVELERVQLVRSTTTRHGSTSKDPMMTLKNKNRNDELLIRLRLTAITRVTHSTHDYTVIFRYHFDQDTGLIKRHRVEKIQPAPGRKLWSVLSATILRLIGLQQETPSPAPAHAHASTANLSGLPLPPSSKLHS